MRDSLVFVIDNGLKGTCKVLKIRIIMDKKMHDPR